LFAAVVTK